MRSPRSAAVPLVWAAEGSACTVRVARTPLVVQPAQRCSPRRSPAPWRAARSAAPPCARPRAGMPWQAPSPARSRLEPSEPEACATTAARRAGETRRRGPREPARRSCRTRLPAAPRDSYLTAAPSARRRPTGKFALPRVSRAGEERDAPSAPPRGGGRPRPRSCAAASCNTRTWRNDRPAGAAADLPPRRGGPRCRRPLGGLPAAIGSGRAARLRPITTEPAKAHPGDPCAQTNT